MSGDHTYAAARLRSLEASMPEDQWFLRLAGAEEAALLETVREYYPHFRDIEAAHLYEDAIEAEKRERLDLIVSMVRDGSDVEFIMSGYDFDDMVQAWKGRMLGKKPYLYSYGTVGADAIVDALESEDPVRLPAHLKGLYGTLLDASNEQDPAAVQRAGEKARWDHVRSKAPSPAALRWASLRIDAANIEMFLSLEWSGLRKRVPDDVWIGGGTLDRWKLGQLRGEPSGDLFSYLAYTEWRGLYNGGFSGDMDRGDADILIRRTLLELLRPARYEFFDIMPILYHIELLDRNAELLRTVISGKINRLPDKIVSGKVERALG